MMFSVTIDGSPGPKPPSLQLRNLARHMNQPNLSMESS